MNWAQVLSGTFFFLLSTIFNCKKNGTCYHFIDDVLFGCVQKLASKKDFLTTTSHGTVVVIMSSQQDLSLKDFLFLICA